MVWVAINRAKYMDFFDQSFIRGTNEKEEEETPTDPTNPTA